MKLLEPLKTHHNEELTVGALFTCRCSREGKSIRAWAACRQKYIVTNEFKEIKFKVK